MLFWCFLSTDGARPPLPFRIFSGDGGTDLDVKADLTKAGAGMADDEAEEVVMVVVVVEFILTLAPSAFTRLGIFSRLTIGTGTQGLSLDTFEEKTMCCLLLEVSRLSLGVLNGFELLLTGLWPLIHDFGFICISDVRELQGGDAGDREVLHIEPCRRSQCDWKTCGLTT